MKDRLALNRDEAFAMLTTQTSLDAKPAPSHCSCFVLLMCATKGGTGKSTLSVNLAVTAACEGLQALIIDTDIEYDQQTCVHWSNLRNSVNPKVIPATIAKVPQAITWAKRKGYQFIVIDTPGRDLAAMHAIAELCDFMLTPSQPSPADLKALRPVLRLWRSVATPAAIVLNGVTRENAARSRFYLDRYGEIGPILPAPIVRRVQYIDALDKGQGVSEYLPGGSGDIEMRKLMNSIIKKARVRKAAAQ